VNAPDRLRCRPRIGLRPKQHLPASRARRCLEIPRTMQSTPGLGRPPLQPRACLPGPGLWVYGRESAAGLPPLASKVTWVGAAKIHHRRPVITRRNRHSHRHLAPRSFGSAVRARSAAFLERHTRERMPRRVFGVHRLQPDPPDQSGVHDLPALPVRLCPVPRGRWKAGHHETRGFLIAAGLLESGTLVVLGVGAGYAECPESGGPPRLQAPRREASSRGRAETSVRRGRIAGWTAPRALGVRWPFRGRARSAGEACSAVTDVAPGRSQEA